MDQQNNGENQKPEENITEDIGKEQVAETKNNEIADYADIPPEIMRQAEAAAEAAVQASKKPPLFDSIFDWIELFMIYFCIGVLLILCVFRHSPVIGGSMENTLHEGDLLIVSELPYTPKCGDVIVCQSESYGLEKPLVKRVIAVAGQEVSIDYETWTVTVDGQKLDESYVKFEEGKLMRPSDYLEGTFTVPEGSLFVMGDNRNNSADSRNSSVGFIDERYVLGKVKLKLYPLNEIEIYK